jgi:hypothetical protein
VAPRAPLLYESLRRFCLGSFAALGRELGRGAELPFAFEAHASRGRPALYEYRPLVREFVEARGAVLARLEDARIAVEDLLAEPAAAIYARSHAAAAPDDDRALLRSVLLPLLVATADGCGGFDWDDAVFDRAYLELEASLFRGEHAYAALAPLVGVSAGTPVELGGGVRVRPAVTGEVAAHWPETAGLLPPDFGREPDRLCLLELELPLDRGAAEPPDAPGEIADAVTALRLATGGAVAVGPVVFERLDWRPYAVRPAVPIAATQPDGEPIRLDPVRGRLASDLRSRLALADEDPELGEALDRWELSLFQAEPFRSEQLRESLAALLGGTDGLAAAALRGALLLGETAADRQIVLAGLRALAGGEEGTAAARAGDWVRRALVEALVHGDRAALVRGLDDALLGVRARPAGYFGRLAASSPSGRVAAA